MHKENHSVADLGSSAGRRREPSAGASRYDFHKFFPNYNSNRGISRVERKVFLKSTNIRITVYNIMVILYCICCSIIQVSFWIDINMILHTVFLMFVDFFKKPVSGEVIDWTYIWTSLKVGGLCKVLVSLQKFKWDKQFAFHWLSCT